MGIIWSSLISLQSMLITHVLRVESGPTLKDLDKRLSSFWDLESLGVTDTEDAVHEQFSSIVVLCDGCFEISLPWKHLFLTTYSSINKDCTAYFKQLKQTPDILKEYDHIIQQQLQNGIIEVVEDPHTLTQDRIHYLPHHV